MTNDPDPDPPTQVNWIDSWVARDLARNPKNIRILGIDYETTILYDRHECPYELETRTLQERARTGIDFRIQEF